MQYLLYVFAIGVNAIAWPLVLLASAFTGGSIKWQRPPDDEGANDVFGLWAILPERAWIVRAFRVFMPRWGAITLGFGGWIARDAAYHPEGSGDEWTLTEAHEAIHIRQIGGLAIMASLQAAFVWWQTGALWVAVVLWVSVWVLYVLSSTLEAALTARNPYRDAVHEQAAYDGQNGRK